MLQSSCLPFVLYASQRIACYFCTMKRFLLITIAAIFCSSATVCAQFNTVTQTKVHRKAVPKTTQSATSEQLPPCSPPQRRGARRRELPQRAARQGGHRRTPGAGAQPPHPAPLREHELLRGRIRQQRGELPRQARGEPRAPRREDGRQGRQVQAQHGARAHELL